MRRDGAGWGGMGWLVAAIVAAAPGSVSAQATESSAAAKDPVRALKGAEKALKWNEPTEPVKMAGPLYYVGTKGLAAFLITTPKGHILINSGMPGSGPVIAESIRKLGFKPEEIRVLLAGHAHVDHVGGHAYLQKLSKARVATMNKDVELIESGGKTDFIYGKYKEFQFEPVKVEQTLADTDIIFFGGLAVQAFWTPGHTKGSTTFVVDLPDGAKRYKVVIPDGTSINPGYQLEKNPSYPGIADDYRRTFRVLSNQKPGIWLFSHPEVFGYEKKKARAAKDGADAWVDPEGYKAFVAGAKGKFESALGREGT